jgi:hypothetical protein
MVFSWKEGSCERWVKAGTVFGDVDFELWHGNAVAERDVAGACKLGKIHEAKARIRNPKDLRYWTTLSQRHLYISLSFWSRGTSGGQPIDSARHVTTTNTAAAGSEDIMQIPLLTTKCLSFIRNRRRTSEG